MRDDDEIEYEDDHRCAASAQQYAIVPQPTTPACRLAASYSHLEPSDRASY